MRSASSLLCAIATLLLAGVAAAAPFTTAFDALRADLQTRRATYADPLTAAQRREVRAIDASLARLDGTHSALLDDAKSAVAVVKSLKRGFPAEFRPAAGATGLAGRVAGTISSLVAAAEAEVGRLDDALAAISDPADRAAATSRLNAARAALAGAAATGTPPSRSAALLARALGAVRRGLAIAAPYVDGFVAARLGSRTFAATTIDARYSPGAYLFVAASATDPRTGDTETLQIFVRSPAVGTHEIGAFDLFTGNWGLYFLGAVDEGRIWYSQFGDGSVTLTEYDPANGRVSGSFSFDTMRDGTSTVRVRSGKFVLRRLTAQ